jgi:hypothetical protein
MMRAFAGSVALLLAGCIPRPEALPLSAMPISSGQFAAAGAPMNVGVGRFGGRVFRAVDGLGRTRNDVYCFAPLTYAVVNAEGRAPLAVRRVAGTTYEYEFLIASSIEPSEYAALVAGLPHAAAGVPSLVPCTAFFKGTSIDAGFEQVLRNIGASLEVTAGLTDSGTTIVVLRVRGANEEDLRAQLDAGRVLTIPANFSLAGNDQTFQAVIAVAIL